MQLFLTRCKNNIFFNLKTFFDNYFSFNQTDRSADLLVTVPFGQPDL